MARKSPDAFRTISEVADWLETPAHVLRFWESKFSQVKPIKRAGGRRYYRPSDMELLGGIKKLLHDDGLTIKGVQQVLREQGVKHVASLSASIEDKPSAAEDVAPEPAEPAKVSAPAEKLEVLPPLPKTGSIAKPHFPDAPMAQGNLFGDDFDEDEPAELLEVEVPDEEPPQPAEIIPLRPAAVQTEPTPAPAPEPAAAPQSTEEPAVRLLPAVLKLSTKQRAGLQAALPRLRDLHATLAQSK